MTNTQETPITREEIERRGFDPELYVYEPISYMGMTTNLDDIMEDTACGEIYEVGRYIEHGFINIARLESTNPDTGYLYYTSNKHNQIADIEKKMHADIRAESAYPYKSYEEDA